MLTANATYTMNGVKIREYIIPDGYKWKDAAKAKAAGFSSGSLYKKNQKLSGGSGKVQYVTIHNTGDLQNVYDDGEQYTRATYPNENMGSSRVHFFVDDTGAWQNLRAGTGLTPADPVGSAEVGWHAADGSTADGGNMTSVSLEIIENESAEHDKIARDNGAKIAAWLLWKNNLPISKLVTHSFWNAKKAGKTNADVDVQCVTYVSGQHYCPLYIFGSQNQSTALKNWKAFKEQVNAYLKKLSGTPDSSQKEEKPATGGTIYRVQCGAFSKKANADALAAQLKAKGFDTYMVTVDNLYKVQTGAYSVKANADAQLKKVKAAGFDAFITTKAGTAVSSSSAAPAPAPAKSTTFAVGDKVKCNAGVTKFSNGVKMASWVPSSTLYVRAVESSGKILLVSTKSTGNEYTGRVNASDVHKI